MQSIQVLTPNVANELRASLAITSMEQCAIELMQNSIDAKASSIEVVVDISKHSISVSDDGFGMTIQDLGFIGTRYATSKCLVLEDLRSISTFGFRGEALAAMAELSLMEIISKPSHQHRAESVIIRGGHRLFLGDANKVPRFENGGTTVHIHDLFYKLPVRQQLQYSDSSSPLPSTSTARQSREMEVLQQAVERLALITPAVSYTLLDASKDQKVMSVRRSDSCLSRFRALFGQALAMDMVLVSEKEAGRREGENEDFTISGLMSIGGGFGRHHQYFYLNNRPLSPDSSFHRLINQICRKSDFSRTASTTTVTPTTLSDASFDGSRFRPRSPIFVLKMECPASLYDVCVDPTKTMVEFADWDRALLVVRRCVVNFLQSHQYLSRTEASRLLRDGTWSLNNNRSNKRSRMVHDDGYLNTGSDPGHPDFHGRSTNVGIVGRMKSSKTSTTVASRAKTSMCGTNISNDIEPEDDIEFELMDEEFLANELDDDFEAEFNRSRSSTPSLSSGFTHVERGGGYIRKSLRSLQDHDNCHQDDHTTSLTSRIWAHDALLKWINPVFPNLAPLSLTTTAANIKQIQSIPPSTPSITASGKPLAFQTPQSKGRGVGGRSMAQQISEYFSHESIGLHERAASIGSTSQLNIKFSKSSLLEARVLAQLDGKFVLCTMKAKSEMAENKQEEESEILVAVDQHAADERIRVEMLLKKFCLCQEPQQEHQQSFATTPCEADTMMLVPPLSISLSRREWRMAQRLESGLQRWGFQLSLGEDADTVLVSRHFNVGGEEHGENNSQQEYSRKATETNNRHLPGSSDSFKGHVWKLPRLVSDRCSVDKALLQDLVRDTIVFLDGERQSHNHSGGHQDANGADFDSNVSSSSDSWLRCIRGCPGGVMDIINSKACRGAIMFNQALTLMECQGLIHNLSRCVFPFQCAHGRPSVVPLVGLERDASLELQGEKTKRRPVDWSQWQRRT